MHLLRREGLTAPEPASGRARRGPLFFKELQQLLHVGRAKPLVLHERQLEQAGLQVSREQQQVVRVDEASSGSVPRKYSGWRTMNWSSGELEATKTPIDPERRPARPSCCHVEAIVPG